MRYTVLLKRDAGVVLLEYHRRRLLGDGGAGTGAPFARVARESPAGVWAVWVDDRGAVHSEPRVGTRLFEGMPVRSVPTPVPARAGRFPKEPPAPSAYEAVRTAGVATLLTSADGDEILEGCVAAVLAWDGRRIVVPPADRPRGWSTAEEAVREHLSVTEAPIRAAGPWPLLLVNAVKGSCAVTVPGRAPFPPAVRAEIDRLFESLTLAPG
jgi:hypothetical protein